MAPPLASTRFRGIGSSRGPARDWAANASFSSTRSICSSRTPARSRAVPVAGTRPMPMKRGSTPATVLDRTRASGVSPSSSACRRVPSSSIAAPSFNVLELPAVTVPPWRNAGQSRGGFSRFVSGRGPSSAAPLSPGTIFSLSRPASAAAFLWLSSAKPAGGSIRGKEPRARPGKGERRATEESGASGLHSKGTGPSRGRNGWLARSCTPGRRGPWNRSIVRQKRSGKLAERPH